MDTADKKSAGIGKGTPGPGRKKGSLNKENKALRDMILQALDDQPGGGVEYLKIQAVENPGPFMSLLGKVLPTTLAGDPDAPLHLVSASQLTDDQLAAIAAKNGNNT